ncbi:MAG TPA: thioredoxin family protein, partial [Kofleriaceae bacterium]|nr:thioredoxin family protein [Kofleriaceae bacterium]
MSRWLVAVAVVVGSALPARADDPAPPPIDDAIRRAADADKPLILEFSTDWCAACKLFEARTLPDARVQGALAGVVLVRYDAEKAPGEAAAERYQVSAYPTFLVIDKQGAERARQVGGLAPPEFVDWLASAPSRIEDEAT